MNAWVRRVIRIVVSGLATTSVVIRRVALLQVPIPIDRWGLYLPLALAVFCYAWWACLPVYPGYAIGVLAFLAVIMTVRAESLRRFEKVLWVIFSAVLLIIEIRVVASDRKASDTRQAIQQEEQQTRFEATLDRFQSISTSQRKMLKAEKNLNGLSQKALENITGGDSFPVVHVIPNGQIFVTVKGRSLMHSLSMRILDEFEMDLLPIGASAEQYWALYQNVDVGEVSPYSAAKMFQIKPLVPHGGIFHYKFFLFADNGNWNEDYQAQPADTQLLTAYRVLASSPVHPKLLCESHDPNFPLDSKKQIDWSWAVHGKVDIIRQPITPPCTGK